MIWEVSMDIGIFKTQIVEILENICIEKITDTSVKLLEDLEMDSLRMVMLLVMIEDNFEIELDESDMNPFALVTVQDVIDLVVKYKTGSDGDENG